MLRHKPSFTYNGLTVILSNPSRFDERKLISAGGGHLFDEFLRPEYNRHQCDIRLKEDKSRLLEGTKAILFLGESAINDWFPDTQNNTLGQIRGSIYYHNGIPALASFFPQDAVDPKNYEKTFNTQYSEDDEDDDEYDGESTKSRHGKTARRNYRFWLQQDIKKIKTILKSGVPPRPYEPKYIIWPRAEEVCRELRAHKDETFFIDLETWYPDPILKCFSFSFGWGGPIYCIPAFLPDMSPAYIDICQVFRSLAIALRDNLTVAHNGHNFDFLVLPWKLGIPLGRNMADTMIMHHRCFSDVEKSLGHLTSLWTWEPFHKDEGNVGYNTLDDLRALMAYCGKDVYTMQLCYYAMLEYAKRQPGLSESFAMANAAIYPYVVAMLQGIRMKDGYRETVMAENDRLMMQYHRMLEFLIGKDWLKEIRGKGESSMPNSNKQCCKYFHDLLGYPVVKLGKLTTKGIRNPSLAKDNMYKLKLKHPDNPVIDIVMAYRHCATESGYLKFTPWKQ